MPSQHEDTAVHDLDFSELSDDELADIAENDSRSTAQEKAQAEINRREADSNKDDAATPSDENAPAPSAVDDKENAAPRPEADSLTTSTGEEYESGAEDLGALQVQAAVDAAEKQGYWDGTTDPEKAQPPDDSHTVAGVTGDTRLRDLIDAEDDPNA